MCAQSRARTHTHTCAAFVHRKIRVRRDWETPIYIYIYICIYNIHTYLHTRARTHTAAQHTETEHAARPPALGSTYEHARLRTNRPTEATKPKVDASDTKCQLARRAVGHSRHMLKFLVHKKVLRKGLGTDMLSDLS